MRSVFLISASVVLLVLIRYTNIDTDKLKKVISHHENHEVALSLNSFPGRFHFYKKNFGSYPKHYEKIDSLRVTYFNQQKSLTRTQHQELNVLCDSLNVDNQYRTISMKLDACLSSFNFEEITFSDPTRDIVVIHVDESLDSIKMTFALVRKIKPQERTEIKYYLDGEQIDTSRLKAFQGATTEITAEIFNQVTGQCKYYSMK